MPKSPILSLIFSPPSLVYYRDYFWINFKYNWFKAKWSFLQHILWSVACCLSGFNIILSLLPLTPGGNGFLLGIGTLIMLFGCAGFALALVVVLMAAFFPHKLMIAEEISGEAYQFIFKSYSSTMLLALRDYLGDKSGKLRVSQLPKLHALLQESLKPLPSLAQPTSALMEEREEIKASLSSVISQKVVAEEVKKISETVSYEHKLAKVKSL